MSTDLPVRSELEQLLSESFAWVDHGESDRVPKLCGEVFSRTRRGSISTWSNATRTITPVFDAPQA